MRTFSRSSAAARALPWPFESGEKMVPSLTRQEKHMSRFLLAITPFAGHVFPMLGLAKGLLRRGHDVVVYSGRKYEATVLATGARFLPSYAAQDFDDTDPEATFPAMARASGPSAMLTDFRELFVGTAPGQAQDMFDAHEKNVIRCRGRGRYVFRRGVVPRTTRRFVCDGFVVAARFVQQAPHPGTPFKPGRTVVDPTRDAVVRALWEHTLAAQFRSLHNRARTAVGLEPTTRRGLHGAWSPQLVIAQGVPALQ